MSVNVLPLLVVAFACVAEFAVSPMGVSQASCSPAFAVARQKSASAVRRPANLTAACLTLETNWIRGITANRDRLREMVEQSTGLITALNPYIGYQNATAAAQEVLRSDRGVIEVMLERGLMAPDQLAAALKPEMLTAPRNWFDSSTRLC